MSEVSTRANGAPARWSVGGSFLEALATRDYEGMAKALGADVHFRALLPPGPMQWQGRTEVAATFASWFGGADDFEVVDAVVGETVGRLHLSWRIRVRSGPFGIGEGWHVVEQHAYADGTDAIETLDLLCSGFRSEGAYPRSEQSQDTHRTHPGGTGDDSNRGHGTARGQGQGHVSPCGAAAP